MSRWRSVSGSVCVAWLVLAPVVRAADWSEPAEVIYRDQRVVTFRARVEGGQLVIEARHEDGWHTYALDNVERARARSGNAEPETEMPLRIDVSGALQAVEPWYQSPPLDLGVPAATDLQARIDAAEPGAVIEVPNGVYNQPLHIEKGLTLKGSDSAFCVLKVEADVPAIWITSKDPVRVEQLTIKWQRATGRETEVTPAAVVIQDGDVEIRDCQFSATGDPVRSPCAVAAMGFSDVAIAKSVFSEFDFTIQFWDGAKGRVEHCLVLNPGHCGVTVGRGSAVAVRRNIVAGSAYHGVRCTGGTVTVEDNLILHNRNRGIYLGNRTAHGTVRNNLILNNVTGIGVFADTDVVIENNVISGSEYAGIGTRDRSRIRVRNNVISANQRGIIVFEDLGTPRLDVGSNTFWGNETAAEDFELPSDTIETDPDFRNAADGDFSRPPFGEGSARHGLSSPSEIALLWPSWQAVSTHVIAED